MMLINRTLIVNCFSLLFLTFLSASLSFAASIVHMVPQSGGYVILSAPKNSVTVFMEKSYPVDENGYVAIGIGRDVAGLHEFKVKLPDDQFTSVTVWIDSRKYRVQRIEGVDMSRVTPPKSVTERIVRESQQVRQARAGSSQFSYWRTEDFQAPIKGRITGVYGSERYYNGVARSPHWGIDYAAPKGSPVLAPASGKIVLAEPDLYYSGGTIVLDHGGGLTSSFLHLSTLDVQVGDKVTQGEQIGRVGSTGRSTGPHLDWRMNLHGERIDASLWLARSDWAE